MDLGFYAVDAWGEQVSATACAPRYCTIGGVAKLNAPNAPYAVANEFICMRLGIAIGLPIPPGITVRTDDGKLAYVSLRFGIKGMRPPPVIPGNIVEDSPNGSAGIIAFDIWVYNGDRHQENLAYVRGTHPLTVFDHSHALLGAQTGVAVKRLLEGYALPNVAGCLPALVTDDRYFDNWARRIDGVPEDLIREICHSLVVSGGITLEEAFVAATFLIGRKGRIMNLLRDAKPSFPQVKEWRLL